MKYIIHIILKTKTIKQQNYCLSLSNTHIPSSNTIRAYMNVQIVCLQNNAHYKYVENNTDYKHFKLFEQSFCRRHCRGDFIDWLNIKSTFRDKKNE